MKTEPRTLSPRKLFTFFKKLRLFEILVIVLIVVIIGVWGIKEVTESALFCGNTCHVMRPHYEEWKNSSHHGVPCIACHITPLEGQQFYPDFRALGQVVSYLTRTYGRYTRAEVEDTSCLRTGCHTHRLLEGGVTFDADITFNHRPHLQQLRRGKVLRCTTCHSRSVMGQHITVVHDNCFICHFKGDRSKLYTAQCTLCHQTARLSEKEAQGGFKHGLYIERTVPCDSCHAGVISGNGQIDEESCARCHGPSGPDLLAEPAEELHRTHVTEHKVECGLCHRPIRHEMPMEALRTSPDCSSCHENKHAGIMNIYRGTGARGVPPQPSPMFMASVACVGCHRLSAPETRSLTQFRGDTLIAVDTTCSQCHGTDMSGQLEDWKVAISAALAGAERALKRAEAHIDGLKDASALPDAGVVLEEARHNLLFVRTSSPIHNSNYAFSIIEKAVTDLNGLLTTGTQR